MISWSAINSADDQDSKEVHVTKEGVEHSLRSLYERAIEHMSISVRTGDDHWNDAIECLQVLLDRLSELEDEEKRKRLGYLAFKNMSRLKESALNFRGAMLDALSALDLSPVENDTSLLCHIALLSLKIGDAWTCSMLLFSDHLASSLPTTLNSLHHRWTVAKYQSSSIVSIENDSRSLQDTRYIIRTVAFGDISEVNSSLQVWTSQVLDVVHSAAGKPLVGSDILCISTTAGGGESQCGNERQEDDIPNHLKASTKQIYAADLIPLSTSSTCGMTLPPVDQGSVSVTEAATPRKGDIEEDAEQVISGTCSNETNSGGNNGNEASSCRINTVQESGKEGEKKRRRKSSRQVVKKLRSSEFDYGATLVTSGLKGGGSDLKIGLWAKFQSPILSHFEEHCPAVGCDEDVMDMRASTSQSNEVSLLMSLLKSVLPGCERTRVNEASERVSSDGTLPPQDRFLPLTAMQLLQCSEWVYLITEIKDGLAGPGMAHGGNNHQRSDSSSPVTGSKGGQLSISRDDEYFAALEACSKHGNIYPTEKEVEFMSWKDICVRYLCALCSAVTSLMEKYQEPFIDMPGDDKPQLNMRSSALRDAIIQSWLGITTATGIYGYSYLMSESMTACESVLIAECCVDLLLQEQHKHAQVDSTRILKHHYLLGNKSLVIEFVRACVMDWVQRGMLHQSGGGKSRRPECSTEGDDDFLCGDLVHLRILWVSVQYLRYLQNTDDDLAGHESVSFTKLAVHNICTLYANICNNRVLSLGHLGPPPPDCKMCLRVVTKEVVESLLTPPRSGLADWLEGWLNLQMQLQGDNEAKEEDKHEDVQSNLLKSLCDHVYLPDYGPSLQDTYPHSEPAVNESLFQTAVLSPEVLKSLITPWMATLPSVLVTSAHIDSICYSKYAPAVYILYQVCFSTNTDLGLAISVTNLLLAEICHACQCLLEEVQSTPELLCRRSVDHLSMMSTIVWVVVESFERGTKGIDGAFLAVSGSAALRRMEVLTCQCMVLAHCWRQDIANMKDKLQLQLDMADTTTTVESLCPGIGEVMDRFCGNALSLGAISGTFQDVRSIILASVVLMSCCEAEMIHSTGAEGEGSEGSTDFVCHSPRSLEALLRCWARLKWGEICGSDAYFLLYYKYIRIHYGQYLLWNVDAAASRLKVLSGHTAMYMSELNLYSSEDPRCGIADASWRFAFASQSPSHVAMMTHMVYGLVISSSLTLFHPSAEDSDSFSAWVQSALIVVEALYSEMSTRGFFYTDGGAFSKTFLFTLSGLLTSTYYPEYEKTLLDELLLLGTESDHVTLWAPLLRYPACISVHSMSSDTLTLLMTLVGQLTYDVFAFPLCAPYYCRNKTDTLGITSVGLGLLPFLLSFIRFCDDDMGVHMTASRAAYNFLYANIPELKFPASYFASVATTEECILRALCLESSSPDRQEAVLTLTAAAAAPTAPVGSENPWHVFFCDFYDGMVRCGIPDGTVNVANFPDRPSHLPAREACSGRELDQIYENHLFFHQQPDEVKNHAHIHVYLSTLSLHPSDVDVWFRLYDRVHDLICLWLDYIGFNIYPLQNVNTRIKESSFASTRVVVSALCGTMASRAEEVYADALQGAGAGVMNILQRDVVDWWDSTSRHFEQAHVADCARTGNCFVSCLDGFPVDCKSRTDQPTETEMVGVILVFAKLNALLRIADNVLDGIHHFLGINSNRSDIAIPNTYAQRYGNICEMRCLTFATMSKLHCTNSEHYLTFIRRAYLSAVTGMEVAGERGEEDTSTSYFLPFMRGQMLWHLAGGSVIACLKYMQQANAAVERAIVIDKIDKRYRALVVCELHKIRLRASLRFLSGMSTTVVDNVDVSGIRKCDQTAPSNGDVIQCLAEVCASASYSKKRSSLCLEETAACSQDDNVAGTLRKELNCDTCSQDEDFEQFVFPSKICASCGTCVCCSDNTDAYALDEIRLLLSYLCGGGGDYNSRSAAAGASPLSSSMRLRLWQIVVDAVQGLRSSRLWDAYDFKSVFIISQFLLGLYGAKKHPDTLHWAVPPAEIESDLMEVVGGLSRIDYLHGALTEIYKLFEKKRPQVVAMWTHQNSPHRFDQWLQRIAIFDNLRCKYISFYWDVLLATNDISKSLDLFNTISSTYAKKSFSAVRRWFLRLSSLAFTQLHRQVLARRRRCNRTMAIQSQAAEFFTAIESSVSSSRCNAHEPQWLKGLFADMLLEFAEVVDVDHTIITPAELTGGIELFETVEIGKASSVGRAPDGNGMSQEEMSAAVGSSSACIVDGNMHMGKNSPSKDARPSCAAIVEWCLSRGWGSAGISKKPKGMKTNGTLSSMPAGASTDMVLAESHAEGEGADEGIDGSMDGVAEEGNIMQKVRDDAAGNYEPAVNSMQ